MATKKISTLIILYYIYEGKIGMMDMIWRQVGMTDGTKTDNGICNSDYAYSELFYLLHGTYNWHLGFYFSFLKKDQGAKPWPNFWGKLDLGITNSTGVVPCSERPPFSLKIASKFCPNWVSVIFTPSNIMTSPWE